MGKRRQIQHPSLKPPVSNFPGSDDFPADDSAREIVVSNFPGSSNFPATEPLTAEDSGALAFDQGGEVAPDGPGFAAALVGLDENEQVAIIEYDAGMSRAAAEQKALAESPWAVVEAAVVERMAPASNLPAVYELGHCPKCGELGDLQSKADGGVWWCGLPCGQWFNDDGRILAISLKKAIRFASEGGN